MPAEAEKIQGCHGAVWQKGGLNSEPSVISDLGEKVLPLYRQVPPIHANSFATRVDIYDTSVTCKEGQWRRLIRESKREQCDGAGGGSLKAKMLQESGGRSVGNVDSSLAMLRVDYVGESPDVTVKGWQKGGLNSEPCMIPDVDEKGKGHQFIFNPG